MNETHVATTCCTQDKNPKCDMHQHIDFEPFRPWLEDDDSCQSMEFKRESLEPVPAGIPEGLNSGQGIVVLKRTSEQLT